MNTVAPEWYFLHTAWRFAFVLAGCEEGASKIFQESVEEVLRHPHRGDAERTSRLLFQIVRRRGLKFPARCELSGALEALHKLPEPARSVIALKDLNALSPEHIQRMLDIDKRAYADAMEKTRAELDPAFTAELTALPISPAAEEQIAERANYFATHPGGHHRGRNPTIVAVVLGVLLVIAVLAWEYLGRVGTYPEEAFKITKEEEVARAEQFEPLESKIESLDDWFLLKGFENFRVPNGFENAEIVGVRIFRLENEPIAVMVTENRTFFYVFRGAPLGIHVMPEKTWRIHEAAGKTMAIREEGGACFLIVLRGDKAAMERLIAETEK